MEEWSTVLNVGVIGNLINVIAEGNAEIARYLEYLYQEKKWRNARNMTSLMHSADLIAYKRQLPKSAIGYVVVSHNDINGIERLPNFGVTFFDLDQTSDFDDLVQNAKGSYTEKNALVPWTADENYAIPTGTVFKSAKGVSFIALETTESRALKEPYSAIRTNDVKKQDFIRAGGWNGIKYLKVPVIQGEQKTVSFGYAKGTRFESFTIDSINVENATNIISEQFFKVKVVPMILGQLSEENTETWEKIANIRLAGPYDKVFETKILNNENKVLIKFGDGITGQRLPPGSKIAVDYLETKGEDGNIDQRFQITQMILPPGWQQIDPRTNLQTPFLSCTNVVPIMGGHNIELEEDIRVNAPPSYLQSYSIATKSSYYEQILKNSPVNLLHTRIFQSNVYDIDSYGEASATDLSTSTINPDSVLQEIHSSRNALLITGIKANGEKIDDPYNELIYPLIKAFEDSSSPNDTFDYIEPNFIEIRPNMIINTADTLTENDIINQVKPEVLEKYSIFNTTFDKPYFKSDIVDIAQNFGFTKYSEVFLEAKTKGTLRPIILSPYKEGRDAIMEPKTLLAFNFKFDKVFAQNALTAGFKNYRYKAPYLIRCDIIFKERPTSSRSLFLFDNRIDLQNEVKLMDAEVLPIDTGINVPTYTPTLMTGFKRFNLIEANSNWFYNQQVRTAQFEFIPKITSPSYVFQMKKFNVEPYEIRSCVVDEAGAIKTFKLSEVDPLYQLSFNFDTKITGTECYMKNKLFIPNCKLDFSESYNDPDSIDYATGYLIIPMEYMFTTEERTRLNEQAEANNYLYYKDIADDIQKLLQDRVDINVYAQPVMDDFNCNYPFDIIFSNRDNVLIQKKFLKS
jgi:hypothetical protein